MTALVLTMPDESASLPGWLDRQLVGPDLIQLVAELSAVHGPVPHGARKSVREVLDDRTNDVLVRGLAAARSGVVPVLLKQAHLLIELQELVVVEGGPYWQTLSKDRWLTACVADVWMSVHSQITSDSASLRVEADVLPAQPRTAWYRRSEVLGFAAAVFIAIGVVVVNQLLNGRTAANADVGIGWGWAKPGAIPTTGSTDTYLTQLASRAEEWFANRPEHTAELATRINEFRTGCSALIFSDLTPLTPDDSRWLVERCRAWAVQLDTQLQALEGGRAVAEVRADVDQLVHQMVAALRERAEARRRTTQNAA